MRILDFLNSLIDRLPYEQPNCINFKENVINIQKEFLQKFDKVDENDLKLFLPFREKNLTKRMLTYKFNQIFFKLNNAIDNYYEGHPAKAYLELQQLLKNSSYVRGLSSYYHDFLTIKDFRKFESLNWFRMREISPEETINPSSSHLFHVPFEKRGKVSTCRFSISGFPCLYLGGSINICWEELNKAKQNIYANRYELSGNQASLRPLNITIPEPFTEEIYNYETNREINLNYDAFCFLITFPIIQICLFKVSENNIHDNFKPEYIIPQLLMQYILNDEYFNSVIYTSTKVVENKTSIFNHNLVLPVNKIDNKGYCIDLMRKIKVSRPLSLIYFDNKSFHKIENDLLKLEVNSLFAYK